MKKEFGTEPVAIKGFFLSKCRIKAIAVNSDLPEKMQRIVVAHEIGHAMMHGNRLRQFHDIGLFNAGSIAEEEANMFATELLMDDRDILDSFESGLSFFETASKLDVPGELLDFKIRIMKEKEYTFRESPIHAPGNFLRNVQIPES